MALSVFDDKAGPPDEPELAGALGDAAPLWQGLVGHVAGAYPPITQVWNHGGNKYGWSLRLKRRDRIVLYLTPQLGGFLLGVVLGDRACERAHEQRVADEVLAVIDAAPRYGEGHGIRMTVRSADDVAIAEALTALKLG